ncbi:hypothetical protein QAD02_021184 [Eretmocerus hayati]|uniref:Uncharacterized protein n=1 Tax=Eretmocerus hayati TaxID=131215 RepID=A0ACC2PRF4_9HYME|nr:hypothetical protein QAD02_021184 [Eretmocerus hayati]
MNGDIEGDEGGEYTYIGPGENTVMEFAIPSGEEKERIKRISIAQEIKSDHLLLELELDVKSATQNKEKTIVHKWDKKATERYREGLENWKPEKFWEGMNTKRKRRETVDSGISGEDWMKHFRAQFGGPGEKPQRSHKKKRDGREVNTQRKSWRKSSKMKRTKACGPDGIGKEAWMYANKEGSKQTTKEMEKDQKMERIRERIERLEKLMMKQGEAIREMSRKLEGKEVSLVDYSDTDAKLKEEELINNKVEERNKMLERQKTSEVK